MEKTVHCQVCIAPIMCNKGGLTKFVKVALGTN